MKTYEVIGLVLTVAGLFIAGVSGLLMDTSAPLPATDWEVTSRNVVPNNPTAIGVPLGSAIAFAGVVISMLGRYGGYDV